MPSKLSFGCLSLKVCQFPK